MRRRIRSKKKRLPETPLKSTDSIPEAYLQRSRRAGDVRWGKKEMNRHRLTSGRL